jgi:uncharacterized protein (DUF2147 family)
MRMLNSRFGRYCLGVALLGMFRVAASAVEPTPVGLWRTVDDKTGEARGFVRLYESDGQIFGKIHKSLDPKDATERCDLCSGDRKNQPVIGLVILRGMKKFGLEYRGGDILDPDTGTVYRCTFRMVEAGRKLVLRGFVGLTLFGRSQTWIREAE